MASSQWLEKGHALNIRFIIKRTLAGILISFICIAIFVAIYFFWYSHRPLPPPITQQTLFEGIIYTREIHSAPLAMIVHIVKIDLTADGVKFLVTPRDNLPEYDYRARTVSQFLTEFDLQLAINGDYFAPWWDNAVFDYYPHAGQGTNVSGLTVSAGNIVTAGVSGEGYMDTLYISEDNHASFTAPQGDIYNAISGNPMLMVAGETVEFGDHPYLQTRHPRTAVGLTEDGNTLILVVVDGRQPNYSEGITLPELSQIFLENGAYSAMNLDGGGSSTLIIEDENGNPTMLNSSIHSRIVARERPVANQLGVYAKPLH